MSEIKPVARVDGRWSGGRAMVRTLDTGANMPLSTELYTADQLAEAVAAERERCAKVCEAHSNGALCSAMIGGPDARGLQNISYAHQRAAQSIRSAAK